MYVTQFIIYVLLSVAMPTWSCRSEDNDQPQEDDERRCVSRSEWNARPPTSNSTLSVPVQYVFIHHTAGLSCNSQSSCSSTVRGIQNYHMDNKGWADIGYSFLIGEDGNVYEGRGWDKVGAHTSGYNSNGIGIAFIGTFTSGKPNVNALNAAKSLINCGKSLNKLNASYTISGHRDVKNTACPGDKLYEEIETWPRYSNLD